MARITKISRCRCRRHGVAAVETPGMIARILLIRKLSASALPFQSHFVFGHIFLCRTRAQNLTEVVAAERYLVRVASIFPLSRQVISAGNYGSKSKAAGDMGNRRL